MGDVTKLLQRWRGGDDAALEQLTPLIYDELRRLARARMRQERAGHTLEATALVHEAYLRLIDAELAWQDRVHFLSVAARVMRRVLVDHSRRRSAGKRGGELQQVTLGDSPDPLSDQAIDVVALNRALERLESYDARQARCVELHYFGGLRYPEIQEVLGISQATVERDMRHARAWLRRELS